MPTYEYECLKNGHRFERFQQMSDPLVKKCPECGGKVKRLIGAGAGVLFKGSGFYITDYRSPGYKSDAKADKEGTTGTAKGESTGGGAGQGGSAPGGASDSGSGGASEAKAGAPAATGGGKDGSRSESAGKTGGSESKPAKRQGGKGKGKEKERRR